LRTLINASTVNGGFAGLSQNLHFHLRFGVGRAEDGERANLFVSATLTEGIYMSMGERTPRASADNVSECPANGTWPTNGIDGAAGDHGSPKEGPMQPKLPTDASSLEKTKQALQHTRTTMVPVELKEFQQLEDARWARQDPDVLVQYLGEFVVPYQRKIVAHGKDAAVVLATAAQITGRPAEELPLVGVVDPLLEMPR
jgi:hypothetical protein